jgi:tetratricopeptide (TPR) repeat protein
MAIKAKPKPKAAKKAGRRASTASKSVRLKTKSSKAASSNNARSRSKSGSRVIPRQTAKVVSRRSSGVASGPSRAGVPERARAKHVESAVQAYEAAIKLMHAEEFEKAIRSFEDLIAGHAEEPEIQDRAKVLLHACEKKIQERGRTVFRTADDYYNIGIAELNRRDLDPAIDHLRHALKLMPKGDHILYALATANALQGNRVQALDYLRQSIDYRGENRFLAARDSDFESLREDLEFKQLVTLAEK